MQQVYAGHGVRFRYPAEWEVSEQREASQVSITVASPHTSFWTVTVLSDRPDPEETVATVLAAFHDEYEEVDVYPAKARLCRRPTVACDLDFVCLELLNVARVRAIRTKAATVLVLYQGTDGEFAETGPILERITGSLTFASDDSPEGEEPAEDDAGP